MLDLRSKARQKLLAYFFTNPHSRLHVRDLASRLGVDPSNLSRELRRLERAGLFRSELSGRQRYYQLNRNYPLFAEVRGIVEKTLGVRPLLARALGAMPGIEEAFLFGSFARSQQDAASDVDVLVIGTPDGRALALVVERLERRLGREIHYTAMSRSEFVARSRRRDPFLEGVRRGKPIPLVKAA